MNNKNTVLASALAVGFLFVGAAQAADPAVRCEARKLRKSGRYSACRLGADARAAFNSTAADYSDCETKFALKWGQVETKAGPGVCPSEGDKTSIDDRVTLDAAEIATLLAGGSLPACGDASLDSGEQCDGANLAGADCVALGFTGGALSCDSSCFFDQSACTADGLVVGVDPILPASGETSSFGAGSDGAVQAGAAPSFTDNGDGTITDNNTGLMWEKKDDSGGIHDQDDKYDWSTGTNNMDGSIVTTFISALNDVPGAGANCFAGHCDWRIPNVKELTSIVDYGVSGPSIDAAFHHPGTCTGCSDVSLASCSCTALSNAFYWSSTSVSNIPNSAWMFFFFTNGSVFTAGKVSQGQVRAVRGGL